MFQERKNMYTSHRGGLVKGGLWKFHRNLCSFHCSVLCPETGLDPCQGSPFQIKDGHIHSVFIIEVFPSQYLIQFPFHSHTDLCQAASLSYHSLYPENLYRSTGTCTHTHFPFLGSSSMQTSNKVKDKSAISHVTLCARP